ncbi:MAG: glycosyltransferase [Boseongicola sp.]|nr:glycosyltransferase [Boseongicola sp.]
MPAPLSVVIPTLNAAAELPATSTSLLSGATDGLIRELILSDGGSTDETKAVASQLGAVWLEGPPGRGSQITRAVAVASAPWLLILHADTHLSPEWAGVVQQHMNDHPGKAGYFNLRFRAKGMAPCLVASAANVRSRRLGLPYGDQGLLISHALLDRIGGIPELPLMEDVALARRLRGRLLPLDAVALTSAERYQSRGWLRQSCRNLSTLVRYLLGADPEKLAERYRN